MLVNFYFYKVLKDAYF